MSQQRYEVKGKIGQGGLGEVYLAHDTQLDREVALKRMKIPDDGNMEAIAADLFREAKTLSALQHPNIVTVYDVGKDQKGPYLVLELLKGETLDSVIERGGMTLDDFKQVVVQTLEGLVAAQAAGLVHRDLKPGNLMVVWLATGKFQIKILDFGLAKFSQKARPQTQDQEGGIFGSIFFMAPEQFERLPLDSRTDMYSLGCIYYQILSTKHPFDGETGVEVMASHLQHHVVPLKQLRPDLPDWLCHWVMWLISREMDDRPPDARTALEFFQSQRHGVKGVPNVPPPSQLQPIRPGTARVGPSPAFPPGGSVTQQMRGGGSTMVHARSSIQGLQRVAPEEKKSRAGLFVVIGLLVALAGGAVWFFFLRGGGGADSGLLDDLAGQSAPKGDAATVSKLAAIIRDNESSAGRAADVLKKLQGTGITEAIVTEAERTSATKQRTLLIEALAGHRAEKSVTAQLLKLARDNPGTVRAAVMKVLPAQATSADLRALFEAASAMKEEEATLLAAVEAALAQPQDAKEREKVVVDAMPVAPRALRKKLYLILGRTDSSQGRRQLQIDYDSPDEAVQKIALEATTAFAPHKSLVDDIFRSFTASAHKELAMTTYCEMVRRMGYAADERLALLKKVQTAVSGRAKEEWLRALRVIADPAAAEYAKSVGENATAEAITRLVAARMPVGKEQAILPAEKADIVGAGDATYSAVNRTITGWKDPATEIGWDLEVSGATTYIVEISQASNIRTKRTYRVIFGGSPFPLAEVQSTGNNDQFAKVAAGECKISKAGVYRLWLEPVELDKGEQMMNVREVILKPK